MPPRQRLPAAERRYRLLVAAQQLFGAKGYRKTEVEQIARTAGVTKPMLYRHFPGGKSEVFMAVLDEHIRVLLKVLWEAMASSDQAIERLRSGLEAYLEFAEENPEGFKLLVDSSAELDPGVGDMLRDVRNSIARGLEVTIADVMRGAKLDPGGAPVYAHALLGGVESVVAWWLAEKPVSRRAVVDYLLAFLWRGFGGLPRDPSKFRSQKAPDLLKLLQAQELME